jgi:hypothetical protein
MQNENTEALAGPLPLINTCSSNILSGCNNSGGQNPGDNPQEARQAMLADAGAGISGQELALEKQKLNTPQLSNQIKDEAVHKIAAYYLFRADLQGLENYTNTLADSRYKAQFNNILYQEQLENRNIAKAQQHRQYISNTFTDNETNKWAMYAEVSERMAHFTDSLYTPTAQDTTQLQQVANYSALLSESACRILGNSGLCFNNNMRKASNIVHNYPKISNSGRDSLNLVPNFSFELIDSTICITTDTTRNSDGELNYNDTGTTHFAGWYHKKMSPDLFNECNKNNPVFHYWGAPNNWRGYQYPASGNGYVGMATNSSPTAFEFTGAQLTKALDTTKSYYVGFKVVLSEKSLGVNNKQGVLFSTNPIPSNTNVLNRMHVYSDSIIRDTLNWVTIIKKYKPDSAYQFITIGNLFNRINTDTDYTNYPNTNCSYCYYFDDIVVS